MEQRNLRYLMALLLVPFFILAAGVVRAAGASPDELVKDVTSEVLNILRQDKDIRSGNRQRAMELIENKVAPHFDFARMTSLAVGRAWQKASGEQRSALTREFHTLLVRTYANSLTSYRDQNIRFKPSKAASGDEVVVHSEITKPGAQAIPLDYSLAKSGDDWKVFDVAIGNISLVTNYRNNFANEVEKGGVDGLLKALQEKNHRRETDTPPAA